MNTYIRKDDVLKIIEEITEEFLNWVYEEDDAVHILYKFQERFETELEGVEENENYHIIKIPEKHGDLIDRKDVLDLCEFIGERPTVDNPYSENYACKSEVIEKIPTIVKEDE